MNTIQHNIMGYVNGVQQPLIMLNVINDEIAVAWEALPPALQATTVDSWQSMLPINVTGNRAGRPTFYFTRGGILLSNLLNMALSYRSPVKGITALRRHVQRACSQIGYSSSTILNEEGRLEVSVPYPNMLLITPANFAVLRSAIYNVLVKWDRAFGEAEPGPTHVESAYRLFLKKAMLAEAATFTVPSIQYFLLWIRGLTELYRAMTIPGISTVYSEDAANLNVVVNRGFGGPATRRLGELNIPALPGLFVIPRKPLPDLYKEVYKMDDKQIKFVKKSEVRRGH